MGCMSIHIVTDKQKSRSVHSSKRITEDRELAFRQVSIRPGSKQVRVFSEAHRSPVIDWIQVEDILFLMTKLVSQHRRPIAAILLQFFVLAATAGVLVTSSRTD